MAISGGYLDICRLFYSGVGHSYGGFPDLGDLGSFCRFNINCLKLQSQDIVIRARQILGCLNVIAILIAPWWPSQPWFSHRIQLCVVHPRILAYRQYLLSQPGYISHGQSYHLHAWRLSCSTSKQQDFQERSLGSQQPLVDPQQITRTTIGGFTLVFYHTTKICCLNQVHLGRQVISYARMEALMLHFPASGFSEEGSRLPAAPGRS